MRSPQTLPCIYDIETLLKDITEASGGNKVRIVFFDCFDKIFNKLGKDDPDASAGPYAESLSLLREALFTHLVAATNSVEVVRFRSWYDPKFAESLAVWRPSFMLVSCEELEMEMDVGREVGGVFYRYVGGGGFCALVSSQVRGRCDVGGVSSQVFLGKQMRFLERTELVVFCL